MNHPTEALSKARKQILVVEDDAIIAYDLRTRLQRRGYAVPAIVDRGSAALKCARELPLDLILMDIGLKGSLDGVETAAMLPGQLQSRVVYFSGVLDAETMARANVTHPLGFVNKPVTDRKLDNVLQIAFLDRKEEPN